MPPADRALAADSADALAGSTKYGRKATTGTINGTVGAITGISAYCPTGANYPPNGGHAVGGGYSIPSDLAGDIEVTQMYPAPDYPSYYNVVFKVVQVSDWTKYPATVTAYAVCQQ
jgi:hypothetical protein